MVPGAKREEVMDLKANHLVRVESAICADALKLKMKTDGGEAMDEAVWMQVSLRSSKKKLTQSVRMTVTNAFQVFHVDPETSQPRRIPRVLLLEFNLIFDFDSGRVKKSVCDMIGQGSAFNLFPDESGFEFRLDLEDNGSDPIVHVLFAGEEIRASPQVCF